MQNIITPVNVHVFERLLKQTGYDPVKSKYIVNGFRHGFSLEYEGKCDGQRFTPNVKIRVGSKLEMWNKVMKETEAGRYAGPFEKTFF